MRIPKSPDEVRKSKAARQKRWRDGVARREAAVAAREGVAAAVDHAMGLDAPGAPAPKIPSMSSGDLAQLMRDRIHTIVSEMDDADLLNKDFAPSLALGLKAQSTIDAREKLKAKQGMAELGRALLGMLSGQTYIAIDDGNTIEGVAVEVDAAE